jgi:hypothetical protein
MQKKYYYQNIECQIIKRDGDAIKVQLLSGPYAGCIRYGSFNMHITTEIDGFFID